MYEESTQRKMTIDEVVPRLIEIIDQGLISGMGNPIPGQLCVEAAVCLALGVEHSDMPTCVHGWLVRGMICLNDQNWESVEVRANALRRLAILQLGTNPRRFDTPLFDLEDQVTFFREFSFHDFAKSLVVYLTRGRIADLVSEYIEKTPREEDPEKRDPRWDTIVDSFRSVTSPYEAIDALGSAAWIVERDGISRYDNVGLSGFLWCLFTIFGRANSMDFLNDVASQFAKLGGTREILHLIHAIEAVLIEMKVPGVKFLELVPPTPTPEP